MPHLTETVEAFASVIGEIREFQSVHDSHNRQLRETTQRSKDLERRARSLRNRLVAGLQSTYGADNLVLLDFGINPRLKAGLITVQLSSPGAGSLASGAFQRLDLRWLALGTAARLGAAQGASRGRRWDRLMEDDSPGPDMRETGKAA